MIGQAQFARAASLRIFPSCLVKQIDLAGLIAAEAQIDAGPHRRPGPSASPAVPPLEQRQLPQGRLPAKLQLRHWHVKDPAADTRSPKR